MLFSLLLFLAEVLSFYCPAIHTYITSRCTGRTGKRILGKQKAPISACFTHKVFKKRQFYTALLLEQKEVALNHIPQPPRSPSTLTCGLPAPPPRCRLWGADTRGSTVQVFLWLTPRAVGTEGNIPKAGGCNLVLLTTAKRPAARNNTGSQHAPLLLPRTPPRWTEQLPGINK